MKISVSHNAFSIHLKPVLSLLLLIIGVSICFASVLMTNLPYKNTTAVVKGKELRLNQPKSFYLVHYQYSVEGKPFFASHLVPAFMGVHWKPGTLLSVFHHPIFSDFVMIGRPPNSSNLFLLGGVLFLIGLSLRYFKNYL
jgi:hypothetical protein